MLVPISPLKYFVLSLHQSAPFCYIFCKMFPGRKDPPIVHQHYFPMGRGWDLTLHTSLHPHHICLIEICIKPYSSFHQDMIIICIERSFYHQTDLFLGEKKSVKTFSTQGDLTVSPSTPTPPGDWCTIASEAIALLVGGGKHCNNYAFFNFISCTGNLFALST